MEQHHQYGTESDADTAMSPGLISPRDVEAVPNPRDKNGLHTPLLQRKKTLLPDANYSVEQHQAMIGANVSPIESLDYEYVHLSIFSRNLMLSSSLILGDDGTRVPLSAEMPRLLL